MADILTRKKSSDLREALRLFIRDPQYGRALSIFSQEILGCSIFSAGFHGDICRWAAFEATQARIAMLLVPRGFLKTTIFTEDRTLHRIVLDPNARHLIACETALQAQAILANIKTKAYNAPAQGRPPLAWIFPDIFPPNPESAAPEWTKEAVTLIRQRKAKESTIETVGVEGEKTGRHYDFGIFDDIVGLQNVATRDSRIKVFRWWEQVQPQFNEPWSRQDINATPWAFDDANAQIEDRGRKGFFQLAVYRRPCWTAVAPQTPGAAPVVERDGIWYAEDGPGAIWYLPAWPEARGVAYLVGERNRAVADFPSQYLLDPVDASAAYFPRDAIKPNIRPRQELMKAFPNLWVTLTIDPAVSKRNWADYTALAVVGWTERGEMVLLDMVRRRMTETELIDLAYFLTERWAPRAIGMESIGFQKWGQRIFVLEGEKRGKFLPVVALERDSNKQKWERIRTLKPFWDQGALYLASEIPALEEFLQEAERWRAGIESTHDDMLDALADSLQLRAQPRNPERTQRLALEAADQEWARDQHWAVEIETARAAAGMPPLDKGSMRMAQGFKRMASLASAWRGVNRSSVEAW